MDVLFKIAEGSAHFILYFMGFLSVVSGAIMMERFFALRRISRDSQKIAVQFRAAIETQSPEVLENVPESNVSLEGKAIGYGLQHIHKFGIDGLHELFQSYKALEKPNLERNLNLLGTIASNAPYIGLLGTVMGIMKAFDDMAKASGGGNEVVMAGIAHALVSTAIGLALAIPAVIGFNFFQKKVSLILGNVDAAKDLCLMYSKLRKG
ncbi:MAG: MotA/TolQ/ExbB proton channel family protein [Bdellovibrionaceae bacterium]|nr:MotA/TolQ/ExbB proton channel family protein [Pseudobdellovibrionaceae bacterium]